MAPRQLRLLLHALSKKGRRPRRPGDVQPPRFLPPTRRRPRQRRQAHLRRRPRPRRLAQRASLERRPLAAHQRLGRLDEIRTLPDGPEERHAAHRHHQRQKLSLRRRHLQRQALHHHQRRRPALPRLRRRRRQLRSRGLERINSAIRRRPPRRSRLRRKTFRPVRTERHLAVETLRS